MTLTELKVRGRTIKLDIREELEKYDWGYRARWTEDRLIAKSPFREDNSPSFYINYEGKYAGRWGDSGAVEPRYSHGQLPSLIAEMRGISFGEACEYLIDSYGISDEVNSDSEISLPKISLKPEAKKPKLKEDDFEVVISPYLLSRGIGEEVQLKYGIRRKLGTKGFVSLVWTDERDGSMESVKHRATSGRDMYYEKGSIGINSLVYGLEQAKNKDYVIIVEGEVDALSFAQAGYNAVAVGTANISKEQAEKIKYQGYLDIYLGGDNDEAGTKFNRQLYGVFKNHSRTHLLSYGEFKDANDVLCNKGEEGIKEVMIKGSQIVHNNLLTFK